MGSTLRYTSYAPLIKRLLFLCLVTFFSFLTGIFLPFPLVAGSLSTHVTDVGRRIKTETLVRVSQIGHESIGYQKEPPSRQVLAAQTNGGAASQGQWGVATQIGEHTWTINVGSDPTVGTAQEILQALNNYRTQHGSGTLVWNDALASFAQSRADMFQANGQTDAHAGFTDFINNQDGFHKLGFFSLGENSSIGYHVEAVHLIEWIYASDAPHNNNQLNPQWSDVGIGVAGLATDLVFGGRKI